MPVTVVVGGQFGSEGKGKVAHLVAARSGARIAVRVGGPNAGHTVVDADRRLVFRQLPTASILPGVTCVLGPGAVIDPDVLLSEIAVAGLTPDRVYVDPKATVITAEDGSRERDLGLRSSVGSTLTGTGAALQRRIGRGRDVRLAKDEQALRPYLGETAAYLRDALQRDERVVIEGTQGFGLSLLHSPHYPYATSRDTTAAACVSEAGLSPLDVDEVFLVIRAFPIRVAGNSGPLKDEIDWEKLTAESGSSEKLIELTSVTARVRRVARFDPEIVRQAITVNRPTHIILNHVDYVDARACVVGELSKKTREFIVQTERAIGARIALVGLGPDVLVDRRGIFAGASASGASA